MTSDVSETTGTPSPEVLVAHLAGEAVLLNLADKRYYRLNETAAFIWKAIERGAKRDEIVSSIVNEYEVDASTASKQVDHVVSDFVNKGLVVD
jgi:hypothetical protein